MTPEGKQAIFNTLSNLFHKYKTNLELRERVFGSPASNDRPSVALYGKEPKSINGRAPAKTHVASATIYHRGVTLHLNPMSSRTKNISPENLDLQQMKSGQSSFELTALTPEMLQDIERMLREGIQLYKKQEWV